MQFSNSILIIAGYDTSNISGNSADVRTCYKLGVYPTSCLTAITAQNNRSINNIITISKKNIIIQLETIIEEFDIKAVKIGMLYDANIIQLIINVIQKYNIPNIIYDPVIISSSKYKLIKQNIQKFYNKILEHSKFISLITPNIQEAEQILNYNIYNESTIEKALYDLYSLGFKNILLKGGHIKNTHIMTDFFYDGCKVLSFSLPKYNIINIRATGCTLSTVIACYLSKNLPMYIAIELGKLFTYNSIKNNLKLNNRYFVTWQLLKNTNNV